MTADGVGQPSTVTVTTFSTEVVAKFLITTGVVNGIGTTCVVKVVRLVGFKSTTLTLTGSSGCSSGFCTCLAGCLGLVSF